MSSYDERQIEVPLKACAKCGHVYYMRADICARCGPGWRTEQHPKPPRIDVNGNLMDQD